MLPTVPIRAVFDIETKFVTEEPYDTEVSLVTVIDSSDPEEIRYFHEDEMTECMNYLQSFPGYVGFNSKAFDMAVLMTYIDRPHGRLMRSKPHYDIYDEFMRIYRRRISLTNIARNTLRGLDKWELTNASPLGLYRTDPRKLELYGGWDTYITYLLYVHTISHGYLNFRLPTFQRFVPETISRPGL